MTRGILLWCKGFPGGSDGKEISCSVGDQGSIPGLGRSPGEGNGYPLQYSGLENSVNCIVYGVAKSRTQLSDFHFHFYGVNCDLTRQGTIFLRKGVSGDRAC